MSLILNNKEKKAVDALLIILNQDLKDIAVKYFLNKGLQIVGEVIKELPPDVQKIINEKLKDAKF
jgi:hypothetical protein